MTNQCYKFLISLLYVSYMSFCSAAEIAEIHFLGNIVEPSCDFFTSIEQSCQNKLKDLQSKLTLSNSNKINSDNEINDFIKNISETNLASAQLVKVNDSIQLENLIIKYK